MIKLEIKKAIVNKYFFIAIIIGCAITVLSLLYNVGVYHRHLEMLQELNGEGEIVQNPLYPMFSIFSVWIGGEPFSMGSAIFFFVFPLVITIPYAWSYCEEKGAGYTRVIVVQAGKRAYFLSKYIAVFISGGLAMLLPLIFNFVSATLFFPIIVPVDIYLSAYGISGKSLMSGFYYTNPFLYVALYLFIIFIFAGLIACISYALSSFIKYRVIVVILPFFLLLAFHYMRQFIYTSLEAEYAEISPLFFLRPVPAAYDANWSIILIEACSLFLVTVILSLIWERKREIY